MNPINIAVLAVSLCAGVSWGAPAEGTPAKTPSAAAKSGRLVTLETPALKAVEALMTAEKECQCSKWEITYEEECTAWDSQGNCTKKQTVRRRRCIEWDHCHDKA